MGSASLLVVDDNELNRDLLTRRLRKRGYLVTAVEDGYAALDAMAEQTFDLVLLDIMMPGMSGLDVLRVFRTRYTRARLPIIMATAKAESKDVVEAMQLGANDYVTKPIDFPVLLARVEAQLEMRERVRPRTGVSQVEAGKLEPGTVIDKRYQLESVLGMGGYAMVYKARQLSTGQLVAVKVLNPTVLASVPDAATEHGRFQQEMRIIAELNHPNIVQLFDCGQLKDGHLYTVLEYIEGQTLHEALKRDSKLPPKDAMRLMGQVLEAMAAAHERGIVHRDLKPANIMLARSGPRTHAKVLDFGIAAVVRSAAGGRPLPDDDDEPRGTPSFMAPEQVRGDQITPATDIYAWGLILLQCLTGQIAVRRSSRAATLLAHLDGRPVEIPHWIRGDLRQILLRSTAKATDARYPSAQAAFEDFDRCPVDFSDTPIAPATTVPGIQAPGYENEQTMIEVQTQLTPPPRGRRD